MINWLEGVSWFSLTLFLGIVIVVATGMVVAVRTASCDLTALADSITEPPAPGDVSVHAGPPPEPAPSPVPGPPRLVVRKSVHRSGDVTTDYSCTCYEIHNSRGRLLFARFCRGHADRAHFVRWEKEFQP